MIYVSCCSTRFFWLLIKLIIRSNKIVRLVKNNFLRGKNKTFAHCGQDQSKLAEKLDSGKDEYGASGGDGSGALAL